MGSVGVVSRRRDQIRAGSAEIAEGRDEVLEEGMTFHLHRVLRVPGVVGVGFSETAVITARGYEVLTDYPRELVVIGDSD